MKDDRQECNTDEDYHRGLTTAQLQFELEHHTTPYAAKHYSKASLDKRVKLISKILLERIK